MVVYEVNLTVDDDIVGEFMQWLSLHMSDMLGFRGFQKALLMNVDEDNAHCLTVWYFVESMSDLQAYFRNGAERMRADGLSRFGGKFEAKRRILTLVEEQTQY